MSALENLKHINGRVAVVGSMNADYTVRTARIPVPGETVAGGELKVLPGGKSSNQAAAAGLLGAQVGMFGALGNDDNGTFLKEKLENAGVNTDSVQFVDAPSGTTVITVSEETSDNTIVYSAGANHTVTPEYINAMADSLTSYKVLGLCLESPLESVIEAARIASQAGMTVLLNDSPFMENLPSELLENVDILLANEHEIAQILGLEISDWDNVDWSEVARELDKIGISQAVITLGAAGSCVLDHGTIQRIDGVRVEAVDTTGCGDSYMGTVLAGLASGFSLADSAQMATYVSAYAACGHGAQASYGTAKQIREFFA